MNALAESKIEQLRPVEKLIFQVAHYLLGDEAAAAAASEDALVELYQSAAFFAGDAESQAVIARQTAIRHALQRLAGAMRPRTG